MRLYYFTTLEHGLHAIRDRRLKVSEIMKLNDPFEFLSQSLENRITRNRLSTLKKMFSEKIGVVCFCKDWHHPMMWGHYAKSHTGICLGFDITHPGLREIKYVKNRTENSPDYYKIKNTAEALKIIMEMASIKYECWNYENEYRIIKQLKETDPVNEMHFINFDTTIVLKEIIAGSASQLKRERIERALGDSKHEIDIFRSRPAFREFNVVKDQRSWK